MGKRRRWLRDGDDVEEKVGYSDGQYYICVTM